VTYARVVRGQVLSLREKEFITAARCVGVSDFATMVRHILPNTLAPVIVIASFAVANTMLAEAALSFLGLSVGPDVPTWGGMVAAGRDQIITGQWWIYAFRTGGVVLRVPHAAPATQPQDRLRLASQAYAPWEKSSPA
jgi:peptide/nickel transport system permease protein